MLTNELEMENFEFVAALKYKAKADEHKATAVSTARADVEMGQYTNIDARDLEPRDDITGLLALEELLSGLKHVHLDDHITATALGWQHHVCARLGQNINDLTNTAATTCTKYLELAGTIVYRTREQPLPSRGAA
ncbi:hypothetical protein B0H14DRAFT_3441436 [Mycena olivaceomarginata]|nr:hypothetical protein B0H14DRAFT_3441436 [Mycena olivaceomarginata]